MKSTIKRILPTHIWKKLQGLKRSAIILKNEGIISFTKRVIRWLLDKRYKYQEEVLTQSISNEIKNFKRQPLISIIMPVYNIDPKWLDLAIESIEKQWYENWELCIADDCSTNQETINYLKKIKNDKIKITFLQINSGISTASNRAIKLSTGDYIALLDNDDELTSDALYEVLKAINEQDGDFIYSDEDSITQEGRFTNPHFKTDYNPDLLLTHNYITHLVCIKRELLEKTGGFRSEFDGAQDHDLILRATEIAQCIVHIPKVLYHWRILPSSTNTNPMAKPKAQINAFHVIEETLKRRNINAKVFKMLNFPYFFHTKRAIKGNPLVSIIIPFKDQPQLLDMCLNSILEKTTYSNFEIICINNNSELDGTYEVMEFYKKRDSRISFHDYMYSFNYSKINNFAVENFAKGEHIVLLNNDIEVITSTWIEAMLEHSCRQEVGAVGAKLYYPDNTIQHAGVIIGIGGVAGHSHKGMPRSHVGYFNRVSVIQNISAVTAACLMIKRSIYNELDGLNKEDLSIAFNDVDFCLRAREKGYLNIFTPFCEMYHYESISRGYEDSEEKIARFKKEESYMKQRHAKIIKEGDPYYNSNLTLIREDFSLALFDKIKG